MRHRMFRYSPGTLSLPHMVAEADLAVSVKWREKNPNGIQAWSRSRSGLTTILFDAYGVRR